MSSLTFYILVIFIPQLLWLLSNQNGVLSFCESCSSSNFQSIVDLQANTNEQQDKELPVTNDEESTHATHHKKKKTALPTDRSSSGLRDGPNTSTLCVCSNERNEKVEALQLLESEPHGGWYIPNDLPDLTGPCNIKKRDVSLSIMDFEKDFAYTEPVILTGVTDQTVFKTHSTKYRLLKDFGHEIITVATANTHSYHKVKMTLCEYIENHMDPQRIDTLGNETLYHFGDNDRVAWDSLFSLYQLPPYEVPGLEPVLSFGLAGPGTGVPFHIHGPTFAETVYGRKRWFLHPPHHTPVFHPDRTTLHWVLNTYPTLPSTEKPLECTLKPGEVIYFPDRWWHATLNLDTVVFMSTFYS